MLVEDISKYHGDIYNGNGCSDDSILQGDEVFLWKIEYVPEAPDVVTFRFRREEQKRKTVKTKAKLKLQKK